MEGFLEEAAFVLGILRIIGRGFLGGPVVENPLSKAGDLGLVPV